MSFFLCLITVIFIKSSFKEYVTEYINYSVLSLLFCFMLSVAGFSKYGLLKRIANTVLSKTKTARIAGLFIILLTFIASMFLTNDVALITLIPICLIIFKEAHNQSQLIKIISLQTIGANLGSILTPFGNPQNIFLYSYYNLNFLDFVKITIIPTTIGLLLLLLSTLLIVPKEITPPRERKSPFAKKKTLFYGLMFIISLMPIFHIWHYLISFFIIIILTLIYDRGIFRKIDYGLLLTFICFFIFIGNIQKVYFIHNVIKECLNSSVKVYLTGLGLSQIISNVPCAILLANWTMDAKALILGVNVGGLGSLIASLANVISYNYFKNFRKSQKNHYIRYFCFINCIYLLCVLVLVYLIQFKK
ncbi:MAG: anion permease [Abditibacteriota bacterium]|nr:anion permease [Abditibacteriota bacterium]